MKHRWVWIALVPACLGAQYFVLVARHEACHALAAWWDGAEIVEMHLWPPRGLNLSWTTVAPAGPRSGAAVAFEAALPHVVSVLLIGVTVWWLAAGPRLGALGWNLALAGALFPWLDLALGVGAYWLAPNDFYWIFGAGSTGLRVVLSAWVFVLGALVIASFARATSRDAARRREVSHG